jgi:hypothetical protein
MVGVNRKGRSMFLIQNLNSIFLQIILFIYSYFFGWILYISFFIITPCYNQHQP